MGSQVGFHTSASPRCASISPSRPGSPASSRSQRRRSIEP